MQSDTKEDSFTLSVKWDKEKGLKWPPSLLGQMCSGQNSMTKEQLKKVGVPLVEREENDTTKSPNN